ncbi:MAG: sigma-70 family RNA polymerase sigma factor, partial [Muribaculaceae bacterium]|nr:sigma-70 family RNA polymerase sigma factor [Muribaculaceae bacterium]
VIVTYYVNNPDTVWDILHDGFLIAFASIASLKNAERVDAWLTSIMKNLSLQYLRDESSHNSVPMPDTAIADNVVPEGEVRELTWEELDKIIEKLPEGYGNVFRLAVLDGLSHKEIAALLGIAPHSSSSQLTRAKAMLRRMIRQYRMEKGLLSLLALIMIIWHFIPKHDEEKPSDSIISSNDDSNHKNLPDTTTVINDDNDRVDVTPKTIYNILHKQKIQDVGLITKVVAQNDTIPSVSNDNITKDDERPVIRLNDLDYPITEQKTPVLRHCSNPDWSLSLAYSGISEHNNANRYRIPDPTHPDLPSGEPDAEIDVTETTHHKMPVIISLSLNKTLTPRWSIETGLHYSFMESDFRYESKVYEQLVNQQIHYIGVPLKFNYRIYSAGGFSLYGHGGGALDIPVSGQQSVRKSSIDMSTPQTDKFNIHVPLQLSVEAGMGIQFHFTPSFSIFAEPSIHYYFNPGGEIKTIRQEKPFEFTLPIGLRFTW